MLTGVEQGAREIVSFACEKCEREFPKQHASIRELGARVDDSHVSQPRRDVGHQALCLRRALDEKGRHDREYWSSRGEGAVI